MKKKLLSLALTFVLLLGFLPTTAAAQQYYWNFEDIAIGALPAGFTTAELDGATYNAQISGHFPNGCAAAVSTFDTNKSVFMGSWFTDPTIQANRWLISPALAIDGQNDVLRWAAKSADPSYPDSYNVKLSTTGNLPVNFNQTLLSVTDENPTFQQHYVDLSAYTGQTVYIAFQLVSVDKFLLLLDDIGLVDSIPSGPLRVNAGIDATIFQGQSVTLSATAAGGTPPYSYSWSDGTSTVGTSSSITASPAVDTTYTCTATDLTGQVVADSVLVSVLPSPYTITASPSTLNFGDLPEGYPGLPAAQTVTVTNTGNQTVALTAPTSANYAIGLLSATTLAAGGSATFTVQPKAELAVGNYNETLVVSTDQNTSAQVAVSFNLFHPLPSSYAIAVSANNSAYGTVSGGGSYEVSNTATVKATPKAGYRFVRWLEGSTAVSTNATYAFPVTKARTLKAEFAAITTPVLTVKTTTTTGATLNWTAVAGATGYEVYRDGVRVDLVTSTGYTAKGLSVGKAYLYKIRARCAATTATTYSAYSTTVVVRPLPAAPAGVKAASAGYNSAKVSWNAVTSATKDQVYRATSASGSYTYLGETSAASYTSTGLTIGKTYYYKLRAYSMVGTVKVTGAYSAVVSAKPVPATPTGVTATRVSNSSLKVSWSAVRGATGYQVYRATSSGGTYTKIKETTSLSYTNTGLTDNKAYYYKVRAYRTVGSAKVYGAYSAIVYAKP